MPDSGQGEAGPEMMCQCGGKAGLARMPEPPEGEALGDAFVPGLGYVPGDPSLRCRDCGTEFAEWAVPEPLARRADSLAQVIEGEGGMPAIVTGVPIGLMPAPWAERLSAVTAFSGAATPMLAAFLSMSAAAGVTVGSLDELVEARWPHDREDGANYVLSARWSPTLSWKAVRGGETVLSLHQAPLRFRVEGDELVLSYPDEDLAGLACVLDEDGLPELLDSMLSELGAALATEGGRLSGTSLGTVPRREPAETEPEPEQQDPPTATGSPGTPEPAKDGRYMGIVDEHAVVSAACDTCMECLGVRPPEDEMAGAFSSPGGMAVFATLLMGTVMEMDAREAVCDMVAAHFSGSARSADPVSDWQSYAYEREAEARALRSLAGERGWPVRQGTPCR